MKRVFAIFLFVVLAMAALAATTALSGCPKDETFTFISLRLDGNGDGTVTAKVTNEFSLGKKIDVCIDLYRSEKEEFGMLVATSGNGSIDFGESIEVTHDTDGGGYFCARAIYIVQNRVRYMDSEILHYDADGNRVKD